MQAIAITTCQAKVSVIKGKPPISFLFLNEIFVLQFVLWPMMINVKIRPNVFSFAIPAFIMGYSFQLRLESLPDA